jgi:hypothetical protein
MPLAVVDDLETVEIEEENGEAVVELLAGALQRHGQQFVEAIAVGQTGQRIVEGPMVQRRLGPATGADVLDLQDEALLVGARFGEQAGMQASPDILALCVAAAQFQAHGFGFAKGDFVDRDLQALQVARMHELPKASSFEVRRGETQQTVQGRVRLADAAIECHQRHADRRMRERAVEAALAQLELAQVAGFLRCGSLACDAGGELGLALQRLGSGLAHRVVGLLLQREEVQRGEQQRDDQPGRQHHAHAGTFELVVQDAAQCAGDRMGDARPSEALHQVTGQQGLAGPQALGCTAQCARQHMHHAAQHHRGHQQCGHRAAGVGLQPGQRRVQQRAAQVHGQRGQQAMGGHPVPWLWRTAQRAHHLGRCRERGRGGALHQQHQRREHAGGRERLLGACDLDREVAGHQRHEHPAGHLQTLAQRHLPHGQCAVHPGKATQQYQRPPAQAGCLIAPAQQAADDGKGRQVAHRGYSSAIVRVWGRPEHKAGPLARWARLSHYRRELVAT